ncbi:MAG: hypothetical protein H6Q41_3701 [Deltaproteobacteria bacterium]|jgi:hypothetical protein|nr:hypothetical protein [Deltaproteobacteria bacterium]
MRKIGIIFLISGFLFPIIVSLYTDFKGREFNLRNIRSKYVGRFVLKDAVYYSNKEYEDMLRGKDPRAYEKYMEIKKWRKEDSFSDKHMTIEEIILDLPSKVKNREISISVHYFDCVAFSIIIFGLGLGFLLLGKKKTTGRR